MRETVRKRERMRERGREREGGEGGEKHRQSGKDILEVD